MKRCAVKFTGVLVVALGVASPFSPVEAGPSTSPSARQAARLKHNPPRGWIRHYLPDDRYKILGGTWKYVSTELDRFYYPAWAPEMLRRPAGGVIGFASAQDAEEAGYMPGGGYAGVGSAFDRAAAVGAVSSDHIVNRGRKALRITLSDGRSTALLPSGWEYRKLPSSVIQAPQGSMLDQNDMIRPLSRRGEYVIFNIQTMPSSVNAPAMLAQQSQLIGSLGTMLRQAVNNSGMINNQVSNVVGTLKTRKSRLGGLTGFTIDMPGQAIMAGTQVHRVNRMLVSAARNKFYIAGVQGRGGGAAGTVLSSFRPR
ncbi:MAG TPA: hypothetical protein VF600_06760 [Abditibacteriaceae bacterium]